MMYIIILFNNSSSWCSVVFRKPNWEDEIDFETKATILSEMIFSKIFEITQSNQVSSLAFCKE